MGQGETIPILGSPTGAEGRSFRFKPPKGQQGAGSAREKDWDNIEESNARKHGLETQYQGQSTLDECMEEFGCRSAKTRGAWQNWCACALLRIYLCIWAVAQGLFRCVWPSRLPHLMNFTKCDEVGGGAKALWAGIKCKTLQIAVNTDIAFTTDFWTSPTPKSFMVMSINWKT